MDHSPVGRLHPSGRWHISIRFDDPTIKPLPVTDKAIGIDLGISSLVITSDGDKVSNPKHFKKHYRRLRKAQKSLSRKQKGSKNREKDLLEADFQTYYDCLMRPNARSVLGEDGKKLKTRSGETVKLQELLDQAIACSLADLEKRLASEEREETGDFIAKTAETVGLSAVKYADLSQNRNSNYVFSYDKMLNLQGNTAPYMLYAYARVQSISREGGINFQDLSANSPLILKDESELILAKQLLQLPEVISAVEEDLLPNRLCDYLYELSKK